jgi:hypothetical protein
LGKGSRKRKEEEEKGKEGRIKGWKYGEGKKNSEVKRRE